MSGAQSQPTARPHSLPVRLGRADRKALLLGTALVSVLWLGAPREAQATPDACTLNAGAGTALCQGDQSDGITSGATVPPADFDVPPTTILNVNSLTQDIAPASTVDGISFLSTGAITINSDTGPFQITTQGANADGILAYTTGAGAIMVTQTGNIATYGTASDGIDARSNTGAVTVTQTGGITTQGYLADGISARTDGAVTVTQTGDVSTHGANAHGIYARSVGAGAVTVTQTGDVSTQGANAHGIFAYSTGAGAVTVTQASSTQGYAARGIFAFATGAGAVTVTQTGDIATQGAIARGIYAISAAGGAITVTQTGNIATQGTTASGIFARAFGAGAVTVMQTGTITTQGTSAYGIYARAFGAVTVTQTGDITTQGATALGIFAYSTGGGAVMVTQTGDISTQGYAARGINARSTTGAITVTQTGGISTQGAFADGIFAFATGAGAVTVTQTGDIAANGLNASGIVGASTGGNIAITVGPGGTVQGGTGTGAGVSFGYGMGVGPGVNNTLTNRGTVWALSGTAVRGDTGNETIGNYGTVIGKVTLGGGGDVFDNMPGGTFEARETSDFGAGTDLFRNRSGGTVHTATSAGVAETTAFVNLERFENGGLISMVDGGTGDSFTISNTVGGKNLNFVGSGGSTLAVDAFLGGPGNSSSDTFIVDGNVSGSTVVAINNTNPGPGVFNPAGFKVVTVTGATPTGNEFSLAQPIDTGFFDYDLFFTPTGSGFWSLKSYPGAGAYVLPQLVTAAQDIWHQGSSTWFDRTADLRVLLAGGAAATAYDPGGKSLGEAQGPANFTPAVWVRGSGGWLDRNDAETTTANGRTYKYNLDRELETMDFQMGIDFGKKDFFSQGDALVFGLLGGFVHGDLDYDNIARSFNFDGGQVGAYATYLNGGLFVDTLFNAHLYSLDTDTLGFPDGLDANTLGIRTDAGYRFGSFSGGPFLEPLATLEVTWADIDGFSLGGNTVTFDAAANVRGRVGARAGTTMQAWEGTMMEPFVIGSLWGNFTDDNQATLVSTGRTFRYQDNLDDVWGEVSAGVNFFNFSQTTSVFAKVDVTFGDDVSGVGGKAGMRVSW